MEIPNWKKIVHIQTKFMFFFFFKWNFLCATAIKVETTRLMRDSRSNTMNIVETRNTLETREALTSILPYLPLILRSSALFWPPPMVEALKSLARGPLHSNVNSGQVFAIAISDLRNLLSLPDSALHPSALHGYALFFDDVRIYLIVSFCLFNFSFKMNSV